MEKKERRIYHYQGTSSHIKVGHIVVVKEGKAFGNTPGTVTKVTSMNGAWDLSDQPTITCEAVTHKNTHWSSNMDCGTKIPSWFEQVRDLVRATPEQSKKYHEAKRERMRV